MLNVANVCLSYTWGDAEESAVGWAGALTRRGHEVQSIVTRGSPLSQAMRDRDLKQVTVPRRTNRLMRMMGFTDIMVAGDAQNRHAERGQKAAAIAEVLVDIGAIDRDVAGMDDKIVFLRRQPGRERLPVAGKMRLVGTEMSVRDLYDPTHDHPPNTPSPMGMRAASVRAGQRFCHGTYK